MARRNFAAASSAILTIALAIGGIYGDEPEKLVSGIDTDIDRYPFAVSIRFDKDQVCGGAIISPSHILTAAHCLESYINLPELWERLTIVSGTTTLESGGEVHKIVNMYIHGSYKNDPEEGYGGYDVGVVKLKKPIRYNAQQRPISLATSDLPMGVPVKVTAWGSTSYPIGPPSPNLQELEVLTMPTPECQKFFRSRISKTEFCTFLKKGAGTCEGDSGSPLVYEGKVVGVVSSGIPCARGIPDIQTNIYRVRDFVDAILAST